jgi:N4-(beta-N-acetylglucosaminyl)-L-asparaginase
MLFLCNAEGKPGVQTSVDQLKTGSYGLEALIKGIALVEADTNVRSVGHGGWPNMLGDMELDGGVMDGNTRMVGAVGAVQNTLPVCELAYEVMKRLPHTMLTGAGARRFATEIGMAEQDILLEDSKRVWWERLEKELSPEELAAFPNIPFTPLSRTITDPERVRDTTVYLTQDGSNGIHAATSTSGWAWKYPGRLGDSPIAGAGFYADSRYGAAACTHTGEMTTRAGTARSIVLALKLGLSLEDAVKMACDELNDLEGGFLAGVVIHAIDAKGNHEVVNFKCQGDIRYWIWTDSMSEPELRAAKNYV